ncbi:hypothetical protein AAMO2058_001109700 [Amorphochlora amoebiformis]
MYALAGLLCFSLHATQAEISVRMIRGSSRRPLPLRARPEGRDAVWNAQLQRATTNPRLSIAWARGGKMGAEGGAGGTGGGGISEGDGSKDGRARELRRISKRQPELVVEKLMDALRSNVYNDGTVQPYAADDGLGLLYLFSTIDPWKPSEYFGVKRDLGQFERFRLMMYSEPFKHLINHHSYKVLASARPEARLYFQLLRIVPMVRPESPANKKYFYFFISLRLVDKGPNKGHWMPEKLFPTTHPETDPDWSE